jgi:hypothetical protein
MLIRITNGFAKAADPKLVATTEVILTSMADKPAFATPEPTLLVVQNKLTEFSIGMQKASSGNSQDILLKNQLKDELVELLHLLGAYVAFASKGDPIVARSSGFRIAKPPAPQPAVTKPENVRLSDGPNAGEIAAECKRVPGAKSYQYQYTQDPALPQDNWMTVTSTRRKVVLTNLESGKKIYCRIGAVGSNDQIVYSDVASRQVQ